MQTVLRVCAVMAVVVLIGGAVPVEVQDLQDVPDFRGFPYEQQLKDALAELQPPDQACRPECELKVFEWGDRYEAFGFAVTVYEEAAMKLQAAEERFREASAIEGLEVNAGSDADVKRATQAANSANEALRAASRARAAAARNADATLKALRLAVAEYHKCCAAQTPQESGQPGWGLLETTLTAGGITAAIITGTQLGGGKKGQPPATTTTPPSEPTGGTTPGGGINGNGTFLINPVTCSGGDCTHDCCTNARSVTQVTAREGSISFAGNGVWVPTTGDFDKSTGRFNTTGRGVVAGFPNVGVQFTGTINQAGDVIAEWTLGTGGELPGGRAITYRVQGRRQ